MIAKLILSLAFVLLTFPAMALEPSNTNILYTGKNSSISYTIPDEWCELKKGSNAAKDIEFSQSPCGEEAIEGLGSIKIIPNIEYPGLDVKLPTQLCESKYSSVVHAFNMGNPTNAFGQPHPIFCSAELEDGNRVLATYKYLTNQLIISTVYSSVDDYKAKRVILTKLTNNIKLDADSSKEMSDAEIKNLIDDAIKGKGDSSK